MTTPHVPDLAATAQEVMAVLDAASVPACLIGGLVVPRWGQPRATTDVDLSAVAPYGDEAPVLDLLLSRFEGRQSNARDFAWKNRVLLLRAANGVGIDVALAAFPFELEAIERASPWPITPAATVRTCSAEHLVVYKLIAARGQDLIDVEGIVRRQGRKLDVELIRRWGREFAELKEDPELLRPFEVALQKVL